MIAENEAARTGATDRCTQCCEVVGNMMQNAVDGHEVEGVIRQVREILAVQAEAGRGRRTVGGSEFRRTWNDADSHYMATDIDEVHGQIGCSTAEVESGRVLFRFVEMITNSLQCCSQSLLFNIAVDFPCLSSYMWAILS